MTFVSSSQLLLQCVESKLIMVVGFEVFRIKKCHLFWGKHKSCQRGDKQLPELNILVTFFRSNLERCSGCALQT